MVDLDCGRMSGREAADVLGVSLRHVWRLLAAFRREGAAGLAHGNRGREPVNKLSPALRERVIRLAEDQYADYNDTHLAEKLEQEHGIRVSRPTGRRLRRAMGQGSPRRRRGSAPAQAPGAVQPARDVAAAGWQPVRLVGGGVAPGSRCWWRLTMRPTRCPIRRFGKRRMMPATLSQYVLARSGRPTVVDNPRWQV